METPAFEATPAPPRTEPTAAEASPVGLLVFEHGEERLRITENGQVRLQDESILRVPATGAPVAMDVHLSMIMGSGDYQVAVTPKESDGAVLTVSKGGRVLISHTFRPGENFLLQVPSTPRYVASLKGGGGFGPLGYGRAGRWRLRSVPSGAQVQLLEQTVATDVDIARLEPDYVRAMTFTKPGYRPCSFAEARISEEDSAGKTWTVVTCELKTAK